MKLTHLIKIAGIFLIALTFFVGASSVTLAAKAPYKIGVNLALTGPISGLMTYIKNGLVLEQDRVNAQGGIDGHPLELIFEDNGLDITKTIQNYLVQVVILVKKTI